MSPVIHKWKISLANLTPNQARFEKWLFLSLSKVILGGKTGELVMCYPHYFNLPMDKLVKRCIRLCRRWGLECYFFYSTAACIRIYAYDKNKLQDRLNSIPKIILCNRLGYQPLAAAEKFLHQLNQRWREQKKIPHEIGIALGYPLKDVLGFMGVLKSPCTKVCGWQMYGKNDNSLKLKHQFDLAYQEARCFLGAEEQSLLKPEVRLPKQCLSPLARA